MAEMQHLNVTSYDKYTPSQESGAMGEATNGGNGAHNTIHSILGSCLALLGGFIYVIVTAMI